MKKLLMALLCLSTLCVSANEPQNKYIKVQAAIDDELYDVAKSQADALLLATTEESELAEASQLLAQALFGLKEYSEIHQLAEKLIPTPNPAFAKLAYWNACAWFEENRYQKVLKTLDPYTKILESSDLAAKMFRLQSFCYLTNNQLELAEKTLLAFRDQFSETEDSKQNLLDLANLYQRQNRDLDAVKIWNELISKYPESSESIEAKLQLAQSLSDKTAEQEENQIRALLVPLISTNSTDEIAFKAHSQLAHLEEKLGNPEAAIAELNRAIALNKDLISKAKAEISLAVLYQKAGNADEALALLMNLIQNAPNEEIAAEALLEKANIQKAMELYSEAEQSYQAYLAISSNPKGISIAARGKAWSLWFQERYAESAVAFETAARAALTLDEQLETRLKAGDSYWMEKKYEQALSAYNAAAVADPKNKLAPQAAFQAALCLNLLNREDVALPHFKQIIKRYPFDEFADKSRLEIGRIYVRQGEWEKAMETYKFIDRSDAKDQLKADALTRMAIIYYKTADYEEAYKLFNTIRAKFPESKEAVQAFFMRGFCLLHLGKPDEALKICHEFLEKYPESEWITEVMFWAGKYYYNEAKYKDAELSFASIADLYPNHEITPHALYWAGRSATAQDQFTKALEYYSTLAKDHPNSPRLAEARFAQGEVLSELGEFSRAILAFDEVIKNYPTSIWSDLARGRKGDCNFALGADNPIRYKEAKAAYQMLLQSATAPADAKLQAMYKIGRCDEKMDKITDALSKYMEVIYAYLNGEFDKSQSNTLWFTRAAFSAGAIKEEAEDWREAVNIYNRIIEANVPAADEARKRVESIQQKHFYLF